MSEEVASVLVFGLLFMIPIIAILTNHQRKMAEMIHGKAQQQQGQAAQNQDLMVHELMRLREQVTTQALQIEDLRQALAHTTPQPAPAQWDTERLS
ncbi:MAG: hypothetical protein LCH41_06215 [Armatimonadetes bacterium]|nr:hypothetical protein [Armatimonadota bacterium]